MIQAYVGSTYDTPSAAAETYMQIAHDSVNDGLSELNSFISGELEFLRKAIDSAGIGLLSDTELVSVADLPARKFHQLQ